MVLKNRIIIFSYRAVVIGSNSELKDLVKNDFKGKGVAVPQKCNNADGLKRYMTHIDNPDKYQYSKDDIRCFNGADIEGV